MKKNSLLRYLILFGSTLLFAFIVFFLFLPAINVTSMGFWVYLLVVIAFYGCIKFVFETKNSVMKVLKGTAKMVGFPVALYIVIVLTIIVINIALSPLFISKTYSERITVDESTSFEEDIKQVDFDKLPLLDKDSSQKLGDRVMGQMPELVSQFYVSNLYTQINYNDSIIRVTPLEYNGFFKYLSNHKTGVKGYITVDSVTGESKLIKLEKGMKYMPSAILMDNLKRKVRFSYPTKILGEETFELDNEGNPYWVIPTIKYHGVEIREEIEGVIILDPITGKSNYYDVKDVPAWVDHVYSAQLIIEQLDDWGKYKNGFFNSLFGQKNVTMTTDGYNYTVMNDDVYLYTGITSVSTDESNLGFVLCNMRTKETKFYKVPGAEEFSAMASAEGHVQQMQYVSTFPLLINLNGRATYLMSLKDNAGLVKMYAFVDVVDYQKVIVTDSSKGIQAAADAYLNGVLLEVSEDKLLVKNITVSYISNATIDGTTYYYIIDTEGNKYSVSINVNKNILPFVTNGASLEISYESGKTINVIKKIK